MNMDPWKHRSARMHCYNCMWFVLKEKQGKETELNTITGDVGRCRRHAPTMNGYPVVFQQDWCGDHKIDETKI